MRFAGSVLVNPFYPCFTRDKVNQLSKYKGLKLLTISTSPPPRIMGIASACMSVGNLRLRTVVCLLSVDARTIMNNGNSKKDTLTKVD